MTCKFSVLFKFILVAVTDVVSKQEFADRDHSKTAGKEIDYSGAPRAREARPERSTMGNKMW